MIVGSRGYIEIMSDMKSKTVCPHCGNRNQKFLQDNGEGPSSPDLSILCVARVKPDDWSFDHVKPEPSDFDSNGLVPCGMQWDPNSGDQS